MGLKLTYNPWLYIFSFTEGHTDVNQLNFSFDLIFHVIFLWDFEIQKIMMECNVMYPAFNIYTLKREKQNKLLWWSKTEHNGPVNLVSAQLQI